MEFLRDRRRRRDIRTGRWVVEYLVCWENCGAESDTWEPKASLERDVPAIVRAFEEGLLSGS